MKKAFWILILSFAIISCGDDSSNTDNSSVKPVGLLVGNVAPNFITKDINGINVELNKLRGNVVLVDFWASWCGPCKQTKPEIVKIYNQYKDKNFKLISVSFDHDYNKMIEYINENKMVWTQIHDTNHDVNQHYNVQGIPHSYLINKKGEIIFANHPLMVNLSKLIEDNL